MSSIVVEADRLLPEALHAAFVGAFADYLIGPFRISMAEWPDFLLRQGVDLQASRVAWVDGGIVAFALVAPRPGSRRWRLAAMGALPAARGTGAAPALLDDFVARAAEVGMGAELECFERNERALRLYRGRGFEVRHVLNGWSWPPQSSGASGVAASSGSSGLEGSRSSWRDVLRSEAMDWLDEASSRVVDLPLQVTAVSLRNSPRQLLARRAGGAQCVFSSAGGSGADTVTVHSLVDLEPSQAGARVLARALVERFSGRVVTVPALQRDDLGGIALSEAGFLRAPLSQVLMIR